MTSYVTHLYHGLFRNGLLIGTRGSYKLFCFIKRVDSQRLIDEGSREVKENLVGTGRCLK